MQTFGGSSEMQLLGDDQEITKVAEFNIHLYFLRYKYHNKNILDRLINLQYVNRRTEIYRRVKGKPWIKSFILRSQSMMLRQQCESILTALAPRPHL